MGDKLASKRTAVKANVNIIPGYDGIVKVLIVLLCYWFNGFCFHNYRMLMRPLS